MAVRSPIDAPLPLAPCRMPHAAVPPSPLPRYFRARDAAPLACLATHAPTTTHHARTARTTSTCGACCCCPPRPHHTPPMLPTSRLLPRLHLRLCLPCLSHALLHGPRHTLTLCLAPHAAAKSTNALDVNSEDADERKKAEARDKGRSDGGALASCPLPPCLPHERRRSPRTSRAPHARTHHLAPHPHRASHQARTHHLTPRSRHTPRPPRVAHCYCPTCACSRLARVHLRLPCLAMQRADATVSTAPHARTARTTSTCGACCCCPPRPHHMPPMLPTSRSLPRLRLPCLAAHAPC